LCIMHSTFGYVLPSGLIVINFSGRGFGVGC
jgi:hypothetical protein